MAVQYRDGSIGEMKPFQEALTDFLQDEESAALHKLNGMDDFNALKEKASLEEFEHRVANLEAKIDQLEKENVKSDVLEIPTKDQVKKLTAKDCKEFGRVY